MDEQPTLDPATAAVVNKLAEVNDLVTQALAGLASIGVGPQSQVQRSVGRPISLTITKLEEGQMWLERAVLAVTGYQE